MNEVRTTNVRAQALLRPCFSTSILGVLTMSSVKLFFHRCEAVLRNTCTNGKQVRNAKQKKYSFDILNENTVSQAAMAQSVEHATAPRNVLASNLRHSLLLGQNLGTNASCKRIGRKIPQQTVI